MHYDQLSSFQLDALREIGNIGAGNAATALSGFLTGGVNMSVPDLQIIDISKISNILGGPENEVVGILVKMSQDVQGMLLFLLDKDFTHLLINALLNERIQGFEDITEMGISALTEIGNILSGSYVNAISTMTDLTIWLDPPQVAVDMVGAILSYPAAIFGQMGDKLLFIEEDFFCGDTTVKSHLLIMPDMKSLETIMKNLGVD